MGLVQCQRSHFLHDFAHLHHQEKEKEHDSLDESLQQDEYLHLQQNDVASSIQSVSTVSSDIKELLIKISSDMGKILSEMDKMSSEIDMIKNKLDDIEDKVELSNILISTVI
ncbi:hypothetical protein EAG_05076 [Camponotus floridanus]|uniref:Uncharacterized protein n=1 Tax=Camponotus floridanus TaxID=104421 RepID=E2AZ66_CAMFO|nr:hypothetical protein EAG_05076 [Camponotus floridanus]